jgi:hypothetical protein
MEKLIEEAGSLVDYLDAHRDNARALDLLDAAIARMLRRQACLSLRQFRAECQRDNPLSYSAAIEDGYSLCSPVVISSGYGECLNIGVSIKDLPIAAHCFELAGMPQHARACLLAIEEIVNQVLA